MNILGKFHCQLAIFIILICMYIPLRAEDEGPLAAITKNPDDAERCVELNMIDHTHILDDGFILFYMRHKKVFLNALPRSCPGLKRANTFMYRVPLMRLCNVDIITVLERVGGEFYPGVSCGMGLFYPVDSKIAKELEDRSR